MKMQNFILGLIAIMYSVAANANFHKSCPDTVFLKNKYIVGTIKDLDSRKIIILDQNNTLQQISLNKISRATLHCFKLNDRLIHDTILVQGKKLIGTKLFFNQLSGKIAFVDYKSRQLVQIPFYMVQNDPTLQQKLKFYKLNAINSLVVLTLGLLTFPLKFILKLNVYLFASIFLLILGVFGYIFFCKPWRQYKKYLKSRK